MPDRFQCRHIHTAGHRCASPALRHETFCYFHHASRKPVPQAELQLRRGKQATFAIPSLEDRPAIQLCLQDILHRLANHDLDPKRAGLLLYGLQIASSNLPKAQPQAQIQIPDPIEDTVLDDTHGPLAPILEYTGNPNREKSLEQILMEQWKKDDAEKEIRHAQQTSLDRQDKIESCAIDLIESWITDPSLGPKGMPQFFWPQNHPLTHKNHPSAPKTDPNHPDTTINLQASANPVRTPKPPASTPRTIYHHIHEQAFKLRDPNAGRSRRLGAMVEPGNQLAAGPARLQRAGSVAAPTADHERPAAYR